jgi:hypothetical protein
VRSAFVVQSLASRRHVSPVSPACTKLPPTSWPELGPCAFTSFVLPVKRWCGLHVRSPSPICTTLCTTVNCCWQRVTTAIPVVSSEAVGGWVDHAYTDAASPTDCRTVAVYVSGVEEVSVNSAAAASTCRSQQLHYIALPVTGLPSTGRGAVQDCSATVAAWYAGCCICLIGQEQCCQPASAALIQCRTPDCPQHTCRTPGKSRRQLCRVRHMSESIA